MIRSDAIGVIDSLKNRRSKDGRDHSGGCDPVGGIWDRSKHRRKKMKLIKFEGYLFPEEGMTLEELQDKVIDVVTETFPTLDVMSISIIEEDE